MQIEIKSANREMTIAVREQLIFSDTAKFSTVIQQVKEADIESCVLDLSHLDHIDSSGLRMLLLLHDACKEAEAKLSIVNAHGHVKDMLIHCRFDTIVRMTG
jgi:anti-anti-sigma factor